MPYRSLNATAIGNTVELLCQRVEARFPDSGLAKVCRELHAIAQHTAETTTWISRQTDRKSTRLNSSHTT
jgi:hypothetical protein